MTRVIERVGWQVDGSGYIQYDDRPVSWENADRIAGARLDRRYNYAIIDGEICSTVRWTGTCSGCSTDGERGQGCEECGYHGVVRNTNWCPHYLLDRTGK